MPRFKIPEHHPLNKDGDLQAIIINYVTAKSANRFQVESDEQPPLQDLSEEQSKDDESKKSLPKLVSWCLLATQTPGASSSASGSVIRGKGSLPLKGFYVIIDTRMFSSETETSWSLPTDSLTQFLFPRIAMKPEKVHEICNAALWSCPRALEQILDTLDHSLNVGKKSGTDETEEFERKCKSSSSELLAWIRSHNTRLAEGGEQRRSIGRGGYVIAPLKALVHTKLNFASRANQLVQDTQIFTEKIFNIDKQVTTKLKALNRLKSKSYVANMFVDRLGTEKKQLVYIIYPPYNFRIADDREEKSRVVGKRYGECLARK